MIEYIQLSKEAFDEIMEMRFCQESYGWFRCQILWMAGLVGGENR